MVNYKHYVNPKEKGLTCFVTSTCLDFAHLFQRSEMRTRMCISLLEDCLRQNAILYGFVVMPHHIHLVVRPNELQTISTLMSLVKSNSSKCLYQCLEEREMTQLSAQQGLNQRSLWMRSFRANPIVSESVRLQKAAYLAMNPVRWGLVSVPEQYKWSSSNMFELGLNDENGAMKLRECLAYFRQP